MISEMFDDFLKRESSAGIILIFATVLALVVANTFMNQWYEMLISTPVTVSIGTFAIDKPLLLWINDGLMAVFFFLVGLELKREIREGELSNPDNVRLPIIGAVGGMLIPALIYSWFNWGDPIAMAGWAIPAATDIAFALGILALLGSRVPVALKVFLVTLAIIDDIGAIVIIALFYTSKISATALIVAAVCITLLLFMNRRNVVSIPSYIFVGIVLWAAMLKSGVHATLAGVLLAMFIPMRDHKSDYSPVKHLEHSLHPAVSFVILPLFAFANSGIEFSGMRADAIFHPVTFGIFLGLILGKQIGVFGFCLISIKLGIAKLPKSLTLMHIYGCSLLCGIGFTMSLFIGSLAFEETGVNQMVDERLGILTGSIASALLGYFVLWRFTSAQTAESNDTANELR